MSLVTPIPVVRVAVAGREQCFDHFRRFFIDATALDPNPADSRIEEVESTSTFSDRGLVLKRTVKIATAGACKIMLGVSSPLAEVLNIAVTDNHGDGVRFDCAKLSDTRTGISAEVDARAELTFYYESPSLVIAKLPGDIAVLGDFLISNVPIRLVSLKAGSADGSVDFSMPTGKRENSEWTYRRQQLQANEALTVSHVYSASHVI